jgi:hypothetical protein
LNKEGKNKNYITKNFIDLSANKPKSKLKNDKLFQAPVMFKLDFEDLKSKRLVNRVSTMIQGTKSPNHIEELAQNASLSNQNINNSRLFTNSVPKQSLKIK